MLKEESRVSCFKVSFLLLKLCRASLRTGETIITLERFGRRIKEFEEGELGEREEENKV